MDKSKLGDRIKAYREELGLSPQALAEKTGCPVDIIERAEAGGRQPALGYLVKLARGLGLRLGTLLDDEMVNDPLIYRAAEMTKAVLPAGAITTEGQAYYALGKGKADRHMEPFRITLGPSQGEPNLSAHEGEEFIIVIGGKVRLDYGAQTHVLGVGDSMYYNSVVPHQVSCAEGEAAEIYAVIYVPL